MSRGKHWFSRSFIANPSYRRRGRMSQCSLQAIELLETRALLSAGSFIELEKLTASDAATEDFFGISVAVSANGQTVVVGAETADGAGFDSGAAYVYRQQTDGSFTETKLTASDAAAEDYFGSAVAVSADGHTVVVGSLDDDDAGTSSGSAYVYSWNGGNFTETKLTASDGAALDLFGASVAVSADGQTVVVGSYGNGSNSVYVYQWDGASFDETKLTASDAEVGNNFGLALGVSADGQTVVVGSPFDDDAGVWSGSAYVYQADGQGGFIETKLTASDGEAFDHFGWRVAVSANGQTAVVGSFGDDDAGEHSGSAYVYQWDSSSFTETKLTASDASAGDSFGVSVAVSADGQTVVVGSRGDDDAGDLSGSAYVYEWDGSNFTETKLTASDGAAGDTFGLSVAISADGQTVVVGSVGDDDGGSRSGSAYVFDNSPLGQIVNLINQVQALGLPSGIENGMLRDLTGAISKLEDDNPDNDEAAIGKLLAFIDKVEDQRGERLTDEEADSLIDTANDIIAEISDNLALSVFDEGLLELL